MAKRRDGEIYSMPKPRVGKRGKRGKPTSIPTIQDVKRSPEIFAGSIRAAEDARMPYEEVWTACENVYMTGTAYPEYDLDPDRVNVNLLKDAVDGIIASTLVRYPKFKAYPATNEDREPANVAERYINEVWARYMMHNKFREACIDAVVTGSGWVKIMWNHQVEKVDQDQEAVIQEADRLAADVVEFSLNNPELVNSLPDAYDIAKSAMEEATGRPRKVERVVANHPYLERVSPFHMYVDPAATNIDNARWVAQRVIRNVLDIHNDPSYHRDNRKKVQPSLDAISESTTTRWGENGPGRGMAGEREQARQATVWEFWSREYQLYAVWSDGLQGEWLVKPSPWPFPFIPFIHIPIYPLSGQFYPSGIMQHGIGLQEALSQGLTTMLKHRKRSTRHWLVDSQFVTPEFREAMRSEEPDSVVEVSRSGQTPLDKVVIPIPQVQVNQDWYRMDDMLNQYIRSVTSMDDFLSSAPSTRRSATEANIANERFSLRSAGINDTFERSVVDIARKVVALAQEWLFEPEPVGMVSSGRVDVGGLTLASRKNLQSERAFRFDIEVGSMAPRDDAVNRHEATLMLQQLTPFMQSGAINVQAVLDWFLRAHGISDPEEFLQQAQQAQMASPEGARPAVAPVEPPLAL